jgi:hypothetical protein
MNVFPVILMLKDIFKEQDTDKIFEVILSKLPHENDGLIFTKQICPYYPGTTEDILKWKPKNLNTIDFEARPVAFSTQVIALSLRHSQIVDYLYIDNLENA